MTQPVWLLELGVAAAAETVLEALLNGEPPPPPPPLEPLNCLLRSRLAELPRTTPDNVSISFLLGHGLKQGIDIFSSVFQLLLLSVTEEFVTT